MGMDEWGCCDSRGFKLRVRGGGKSIYRWRSVLPCLIWNGPRPVSILGFRRKIPRGIYRRLSRLTTPSLAPGIRSDARRVITLLVPARSSPLRGSRRRLSGNCARKRRSERGARLRRSWRNRLGTIDGPAHIDACGGRAASRRESFWAPLGRPYQSLPRSIRGEVGSRLELRRKNNRGNHTYFLGMRRAHFAVLTWFLWSIP